MKKQRKFVAAIVAINILTTTAVTPLIARAQTEYTAAQSMVNQALDEKSFYYYNVAYGKIMELPEGYERDLLISQLSSIAGTVWTKNITDIVKSFEIIAKEKSGKEYDEVERTINSADLKEIDKQYLLGELTSWGRKAVWTDDYKKAVAAVIKVWNDKTETSSIEAEKAISELKLQINKDYLTQLLYEAKAAVGLAPLILDGKYFDSAADKTYIGEGKSITLDLSKDTVQRTVILKGNIKEVNINAPKATVILEDVEASKVNIEDVAGNSLYLKGTTKVESLVVNDKDDNSRIVLHGKATVINTEIKSGVKVEVGTDSTVQNPFGKLQINTEQKKTIDLAGDFKETIIQVEKPVQLNIGNYIKKLDFGKEAKDSLVTILAGAKVSQVNAESALKLQGTGRVESITGSARYQVTDNTTGNISSGGGIYVPPSDTTAPVITMKGEPIEYVVNGTVYNDQGATARDDKDGDITGKIVVTIKDEAGNIISAIDTSKAGTYAYYYDVKDAAGNKAVQVIRKVVIAAAPSLADLNSGKNLHPHNYSITDSLATGTYGSSDSSQPTIVNGNLEIRDDDALASSVITLQNMDIKGTLTLDYGDGTVKLINVNADKVVAANVGNHSLVIAGDSSIATLIVEDSNNNARIAVEGNGTISEALIHSGAQLEVGIGVTNPNAFGDVILSPTGKETISLSGTFNTVKVTAPSEINLALNTNILNKIHVTAPIELRAEAGSNIEKLEIESTSSTDTFALNANIKNLSVASAVNLDIKGGNIVLSSDINEDVKIKVDKDAVISVRKDSASLKIEGEGTVAYREINNEAELLAVRLKDVSKTANTILNIGINTKVKDLINSMAISNFAKADIIDASENIVNENTPITESMKLRITAEDRTTIKLFNLGLATSPALDANPLIEAGPLSSRTIFSTVKANKYGIVYMVALAKGAKAPTSVQVKEGKDGSGNYTVSANHFVQASVASKVGIVVPLDGSDYDLYFILVDQQGNMQAEPIKASATSPAASSGAKAIVQYNIKNKNYWPVFNSAENEIIFHVPHGTDVSKLEHVISVSTGAKISEPKVEATGRIVSYIYTVTAQNQTTAVWTVNFIIAEPAKLVGLMIKDYPIKTVYTVGDKLDIKGLVVVGIYSNGSTVVKEVSESNIKGFDSSLPVSYQVLTIELEGQTATYTITVNENIAVAEATKAVEKAEQSKLQVDVDSARLLIDKLKGEAKILLNARLDAVEKAIQYDAKLAAAENAVRLAEATKLQKDVDAARALLGDLNQTDRAAFEERLNKIETESQEISQVKVEADSSTGRVKVTGNIKAGNGKNVTFKLLDPQGEINNLNQVVSGEGGNFSYEFAIANLIDGVYTLSIGGEGVNKLYSTTFVIKDIIKPVITLNGEPITTVTGGAIYIDMGATAWDDRDGDITKNIVTTIRNTSGSAIDFIDTSLEGTYTVTYSVSDKAGNKAEAIRTVNAVVESVMQNVNITVNDTTGIVTVEGYTKAGSGKNVTFVVLNPKGEIDNLNQVVSGEEGKFFYSFLIANLVDGTYTLKIGGNGVNKPYIQSFIIKDSISPEIKILLDRVNALKYVEGETEEARKSKIAEMKYIVENNGFALDGYNPLSDVRKDRVASFMLNQSFKFTSKAMIQEFITYGIQNDLVRYNAEKFKGHRGNAVDTNVITIKSQEEQDITEQAIQINPPLDPGIRYEITGVSEGMRISDGRIYVDPNKIQDTRSYNIYIKVTGGMFSTNTNLSLRFQNDLVMSNAKKFKGHRDNEVNTNKINIVAQGEQDITEQAIQINPPLDAGVSYEITGLSEGMRISGGRIYVDPSKVQDISSYSIYIRVTDGRWSANTNLSLRFVKESSPILQTPALNLDQIVISNNVGQDDTIDVSNLVGGDTVRVYDKFGKLLGWGKMPEDATGIERVSVPQLGVEAGSVFVSVQSIGKTESEKVEKAYNAEVVESVSKEALNSMILSVETWLPNIKVGTALGNCTQEAKSALEQAVSVAKQAVNNSSATQQEINKAKANLENAINEFYKSIVIGLSSYDTQTVIESDKFDRTITVNLIAAGNFVSNLKPGNIILGGDFANLTAEIKEVSPRDAIIRLTGNLVYSTGVGTITVDEAGWTGMFDSIPLTLTIPVTSNKETELVNSVNALAYVSGEGYTVTRNKIAQMKSIIENPANNFILGDAYYALSNLSQGERVAEYLVYSAAVKELYTSKAKIQEGIYRGIENGYMFVELEKFKGVVTPHEFEVSGTGKVDITELAIKLNEPLSKYTTYTLSKAGNSECITIEDNRVLIDLDKLTGNEQQILLNLTYKEMYLPQFPLRLIIKKAPLLVNENIVPEENQTLTNEPVIQETVPKTEVETKGTDVSSNSIGALLKRLIGRK